MTRNWMNILSRTETKIISSVTSLKTKVVLMADGVDMECGEFNNAVTAGNWMAAKVSEWRIHTPLARLRFRTE